MGGMDWINLAQSREKETSVYIKFGVFLDLLRTG